MAHLVEEGLGTTPLAWSHKAPGGRCHWMRGREGGAPVQEQLHSRLGPEVMQPSERFPSCPAQAPWSAASTRKKQSNCMKQGPASPRVGECADLGWHGMSRLGTLAWPPRQGRLFSGPRARCLAARGIWDRAAPRRDLEPSSGPAPETPGSSGVGRHPAAHCPGPQSIAQEGVDPSLPLTSPGLPLTSPGVGPG